MKYQKVDKKLSIFIYTSILLTFILGNILFSGISWKNFISNQFATAFTAGSTGDWNDRNTWGFPIFDPEGIAFSLTGYIYITDTNNNRVVVLNPDGTASTSYGGVGSVTGITISSTGEIYLVSRNFAGIRVRNSDGTASTTYSPGIFGSEDIVISSTTGEIYITDKDNNRIVVLNPNGTASTTYSGLGLNNPGGIALSPTGEIYIVDMINNRIVVLNPDGTASTSYSGLGLNFPQRLTLSPTGEIFITDYFNNRVVVLNADGTASTTYSGLGLNHPSGIARTANGEIYITDTNNNRIVVLNADGTASTTHNGLTSNEGVDFPGSLDNVNISGSNNISLTQTQNVHDVILISPSVLDLNGNTLNVYGDWSSAGGTLTANGGTFNFVGTSSNLSVSAGTLTLTQNENIHNLNLSGGTLDLNGYTLNIYGNWSNTGGTFLANTGTVNFVGSSNQSILGSNTFYNLTKLSSTTSALLFDPTATTTVTNNLSLSGSIGQTLSIGPSAGSIAPIFDSEINGSGTIYGVTHDSNNNIYIADCDNSTIQEFDNNGSFIQTLDTTGLLGGLSCPFSLTTDSNDNIYTVDYYYPKGRIVKFDSSGTYATSSGNIFSSYSGINGINGLAITPSGNIYATAYSDTLFKLDSNFTILNSTTTSNGYTFLFGWADITIDPNDPLGTYIYVGDDSVQRIVKLNASDLSFVSENFGPVEAPFAYISDIKFDSDGNIYVADDGSQWVVKLASDFSYITQFSESGPGPGQNFGISQLTIDLNNNVYFANYNHQLVDKFTQPLVSNTFNILLSSGTSNFSYLSVSGSNNISVSPFYCLIGCTNAGGNTNWIFGAVTPHYGGSSSYRPLFQEATSTATTTATTTIEVATTTPVVVTSTSTKLTASTTKPVIKPVTPNPKPKSSLSMIPTTQVPTTSGATSTVKNTESTTSPSLLVAIQQNRIQKYLQVIVTNPITFSSFIIILFIIIYTIRYFLIKRRKKNELTETLHSSEEGENLK